MHHAPGRPALRVQSDTVPADDWHRHHRRVTRRAATTPITMPRRVGYLILCKERAHGPLESDRCGPSVGHVQDVSPMLSEVSDDLELTAPQLVNESTRRPARGRDAQPTTIPNLKLQTKFVGATKQALRIHDRPQAPFPHGFDSGMRIKRIKRIKSQQKLRGDLVCDR